MKVSYIKNTQEIQEIPFDAQILILNSFCPDDIPENLPLGLEKILIVKSYIIGFKSQEEALEHFKSQFKIPFGCEVRFLRPEIKNPSKYKLTLFDTSKPDEEYETKTHFTRVWDLKTDLGNQKIEVFGSRKDKINVDEVKLVLTLKKRTF